MKPTNIHDIPGTLTMERIERVIANDQDFLHDLNNDELADMIFFLASTVQNSPEAMRLMAAAKTMIGIAEELEGKTISYIMISDQKEPNLGND